MKKQCPHCGTTFYGRTDKQFCSLACKNSFHNQNRKTDIAHSIDQQLRNNRSILHQIMPADEGPMKWERKVLTRLGFNFDAITGVSISEDGIVLNRLYEYTWFDVPDEMVVMQSNAEARSILKTSVRSSKA